MFDLASCTNFASNAGLIPYLVPDRRGNGAAANTSLLLINNTDGDSIIIILMATVSYCKEGVYR